MTRPPTHARVTDALNRLDVYAQYPWHESSQPEALAIRHLVEALDRVLRAYPGSCDALESYVAEACAAVGVDGP